MECLVKLLKRDVVLEDEASIGLGFATIHTAKESPNKPSVMRESPQHLIRAAHEPDELFRL